MNAIICLDDKNGIAFNKRRQSRDSVVTARIIALAEGNRLYISEYSKNLFGEYPEVVVDNAFAEKANQTDYCFFELGSDGVELADKLYIFRWNRVYPADKVFNIDLANDYKMISTEDLVGSSHEKITLDIYRRR